MTRHRTLVSYLRYWLFIVVLLAGSVPNTAAAFDINFFQGNDILYYHPEAGDACTSSGASYSTNMDIPSLIGNDNAEKIWNFLTTEGRLSANQTAGVMGNIQQESNFNPEALEGNGIGYGIVQWSFGRRTALEAAAKEQSVAVSDLGFQLAYMIQESQSRRVSDTVAKQGYGTAGDNEWETLKKQETIEDATVFWHNNFEVSADSPEKVLALRGKYAANAYETFQGTLTPESTSGNCSSFGGGDLIETLMAYAHPMYYANNSSGPVPPPKPAYVEIATKLQNEGKWVGGGNIPGDSNQAGYPAIDCGGFVSILLTQSGFEPEYNYGLDMSKGASNQQYGQLPWAKENWSLIGNGGEINVSDLRPGDVAYSDGHTFVFVGQVDGFESQYASASYSWWRAPMAGGSWKGGGESVTNPEYVWYGKR